MESLSLGITTKQPVIWRPPAGYKSSGSKNFVCKNTWSLFSSVTATYPTTSRPTSEQNTTGLKSLYPRRTKQSPWWIFYPIVSTPFNLTFQDCLLIIPLLTVTFFQNGNYSKPVLYRPTLLHNVMIIQKYLFQDYHILQKWKLSKMIPFKTTVPSLGNKGPISVLSGWLHTPKEKMVKICPLKMTTSS